MIAGLWFSSRQYQALVRRRKEEDDHAKRDALVRVASRVCCRDRFRRVAGAQTELRFADTIGSDDTLAAEEFAKKVAQKTGNAIQIDLFRQASSGTTPR